MPESGLVELFFFRCVLVLCQSSKRQLHRRAFTDTGAQLGLSSSHDHIDEYAQTHYHNLPDQDNLVGFDCFDHDFCFDF
jgi:hypothetical protein